MFKFSKRTLMVAASGVLTTSVGLWYCGRPRKTSGSPLEWPITRDIDFKIKKNSIVNLDITLFQYQTCPFCCKVRAYLDYNGINYKVVEVNSVTQKQLKWSEYHKVPIVMVQDKEGWLQLNDSSLIISIFESYRRNTNNSLNKLKEYYPAFDSVDKRGRKKLDFYNKYSIMTGKTSDNIEGDKKEATWRKWVDEEFVHTLAPNIYRSPSEALEAFKYVSECGDWEKIFGYFESQVVIYVGAVAMYFIGKLLKRRYNLDADVRKSLFEEANIWVKALESQKFMGGNQPNLADLAVYGVLCSIEGCSTFKELMHHNPQMFSWYLSIKETLSQPYYKVVTQ